MASRAITVAYNSDRNSAWLFERCRPSVQRYAEITNADLVVKQFNRPIHYLDKYALIDHTELNHYDQVLQLDADVYIHTDEDIFDAMGDVKIAAKRSPRVLPNRPVWFGGFDGDWTYNAGVVLASPNVLSAFLKFANQHREEVKYGDESILVPYLDFSGMAVTPLPRHFNLWANWTNPALNGNERGFFHFSGSLKRQRYEWFEQEYLSR